jgi:indole-3-glycerol phosphate synthase
VRRVRETGIDAALVGEALMRLDEPAPLLGDLQRAAAGTDRPR